MATKNQQRLWLLFALFSISRAAATPFLGLYTLELGGDSLLVGLVYALYSASSLVVKLPTGILADRYGRRWLARMGYAGIFSGMFIYYLAPAPEFLVLGSVVRGLGFGMFHPTMMTITAEVNEGREARRLGYILTGPPIGMILGPLFGSLIAHFWGYRPIFLLSSIISACALALAMGLEETLPSKRKRNIELMNGLREKHFLSLLLARFTMSYGIGVTTTFIPLMLRNVLGFESASVGVFFMAAAVLNTFGRPSAETLGKRFGFVLPGSLALALLSSATLSFALISPTGAWIGAAFYGLAYGFFIPTTIYLVSMWFEVERRATAMAIVTIMFDLGMTAGAYISAALLPQIGYTGIFVAAAVLNLISLTLFYPSIKLKSRPQPPLKPS